LGRAYNSAYITDFMENESVQKGRRVKRELVFLAVCLAPAAILYVSGVAGSGEGPWAIARGILIVAVILYVLLGMIRLASRFISNQLNSRTDEKNRD